MPLNESDRLTIIQALQAANASIDVIRAQLDKVKNQLISILNDIRD